MSIVRRSVSTRLPVTEFRFREFGSEQFPAHQSDINAIASDTGCLYRWKFSFEADKPKFRGVEAIFGTSLHKAIALLHGTQNWGNAENVFLDCFNAELNSPSEPPVRENGKTAAELIDEGCQIIRGYAAKEYNRNAKVLGSEVPFTVKIGKNYFYEGTIDQIRLKDDGQYVLIDFKSGKSVPEQRLLDHGFQFGIYSAAMVQGTLFLGKDGENPVHLKQFPKEIFHYHLRDHIPYLRGGKKTVSYGSACDFYKVSSGAEVQYSKGDERGCALYKANRTPDEIAVLEKHLNAIVGTVRFGRFYPTLGSLCGGYCPYRSKCDGILNQSGEKLVDLAA